MDDKRAYQIAYDLFKGQNNGPSDIFQPQSQIFETQQNFDMIDKRSTQNMTRCVKVPSSEHVAEIVGRQGECFFFFVIYFAIYKLIVGFNVSPNLSG